MKNSEQTGRKRKGPDSGKMEGAIPFKRCREVRISAQKKRIIGVNL